MRDLEFDEDVLFKNFTRYVKKELLFAFGDCGANDYKTEYSFQRISACWNEIRDHTYIFGHRRFIYVTDVLI